MRWEPVRPGESRHEGIQVRGGILPRYWARSNDLTAVFSAAAHPLLSNERAAVSVPLAGPTWTHGNNAGASREELMTCRWLFIALLLVVAQPIGAGERLTLRVAPSFGPAPQTVRVRAEVAPDADNR